MPGLSCFGNISWLFYAFVGIAGCCSESQKLCACDAAYLWSQSPSPHSQWHAGYEQLSKKNHTNLTLRHHQ